jgi:hypothetical protein
MGSALTSLQKVTGIEQGGVQAFHQVQRLAGIESGAFRASMNVKNDFGSIGNVLIACFAILALSSSPSTLIRSIFELIGSLLFLVLAVGVVLIWIQKMDSTKKPASMENGQSIRRPQSKGTVTNVLHTRSVGQHKVRLTPAFTAVRFHGGTWVDAVEFKTGTNDTIKFGGSGGRPSEWMDLPVQLRCKQGAVLDRVWNENIDCGGPGGGERPEKLGLAVNNTYQIEIVNYSGLVVLKDIRRVHQ